MAKVAHGVHEVRRRAVLTGLASLVAVATLPASGAGRAAFSDQELADLFNSMPPMRRLFIQRQVFDYHTDTEHECWNMFRDANGDVELVNEVYHEWLAGFDQSVIDAFESGQCAAPTI